MRHFLKLLALFIGLNLHAQTATYAPLMINKTNAVTANSAFWTGNSNNLMGIVLPTINAERVLVVSAASGNDSSAVGSNPTTPFLTLGAALTNAPSNSRVVVLPGTYAMTPSYNTPETATPADFTYIPALMLNKTNVTISGKGAIITGSGTGCMLGLLNCKDVQVEGLEFNLTKGIGEELTNSYIGPITMYGTNVGITFDNVIIRNATDQGITGSRKEYGVTVRNSYFENIGSTNVAYVTNLVGYPYVDGTAISGMGSGTVIQNCRFVNCFRDVEWDAIGGTEIHSGFTMQGCVSSNAIHASVVMYDSNTNTVTLRNINISGNDFYGNSSEYAVNSRDSSLQINGIISMKCGGSAVISGNNFFNTYDYGIYLSPSSPMEDFAITGNNFYGSANGWTNIHNNGITILANNINATNPFPIRNITISGNQFSHLGGAAVRPIGANVLVVGNSMIDCGKNAGGSYLNWVGGGTFATSTSNVVFRANTAISYNTAFPSHMFAVSDPSLAVYIDRSNVGIGIDKSLVSWPVTAASAVKAQVYLDGKTFAATLVGGTVTISHPLIHANSRIQVTRNVTGGTVGHLSVTRSNETSFTVNSSSGTDTSTLAITVFEDTF